MSGTIQQRLLSALQTRGESTVQARTRKYIVTTAKSFGSDKFFYLGSAGALRFGKTSTGSVPVDKIKAKLLAEPAPVFRQVEPVTALEDL